MLRTLGDAGHHIAGLPKAVHDAEQWQTAMQALLLVAERGGPTMLARIGIMLALNHGKANRRSCHGGRSPRLTR